MTEMTLPTVDDVNATRLTRFDDSITAALGRTDEIRQYRDVIDHFVQHHDVPEGDVAAALALVAQGETPLLLSPEADRRERFAEPRAERGDRPDRSGKRERGGPKTTYRIAVGRRHKVEPRQIVGALANEGGLARGDFGAIQIRPDFSLVDLPVDMPQEVLDRLSGTRISGRLIELRLDRGPARRAERGDRPEHPDRAARKPRH